MVEDGSRHRIVFLPFASVSPDPVDSYFADGLTDELISAASKAREFEVISRTSSMQYKNKPKSIRSIGKELGVEMVLEGSVRKVGNRIRITVQMIDAKKDRQLWAESYDRELQDVFSIQSEVAGHIAETLSVKLLSSEKQDIGKPPTGNTQAYALYLKGRYYFGERTKESFDKAMKYFQTAVEKDPGFALGYAALADCSATYANYGWESTIDAYSRARRYLSKAFEIDPRIAEPHALLGYMLAMYEYKWREAEDEFRQAERLKPSYATAYHWHSLVLRGLGRFTEAFEKIRKAAELDPLSAVIGVNVAELLLVFGKTREAIEQCETIIEANPNSAIAHRTLSWAYLMDSRANQAVSLMKKAEALSGEDLGAKADLACLLGFANSRDEANKIVEELRRLAKTQYVNNVMMAHALFSSGEVDEAFAYLEKGLKERSDLLLQDRWWPWLRDLHEDPRWVSIERRMGLSSSAMPGTEREQHIVPIETSEFRGADPRTKVLFDFLVKAFIEDYMKERLSIEQSGWRSLTRISEANTIPQGALYGKQGRFGPILSALISRGLVEQRTFTGHRGRGGNITKVRVTYDREPTKRYVDRAVL